MNTEWRFERKRFSQKSRQPMQASFFTTSSIDDDTHALVRESIQNSLDARAGDGPVRVRFSIGTLSAKSGVLSNYICDEAWKHFSAGDNGLQNPPSKSDDCRYLVYEDFNTKGLIGDERDFEGQDGNSFYYFMRAEGLSGKNEGDRGRHGIGKYVFPYTSAIRMFIAATIRSTDSRLLVAGQSVLKSHQVEGIQYTPDGWWGNFESRDGEDYLPLPAVDEMILDRLQADFGLRRSSGDTGLSVVMPFIQDEVTSVKLTEHVIREYFWPIMTGLLEVEIVENGSELSITVESIVKVIEATQDSLSLQEIKPVIDLAQRVISDTELSVVKLLLPEALGAPKWTAKYVSKEASSEILRKISLPGGMIKVECPLYVRKKNEVEKKSKFSIYLIKDSDDKQYQPKFIREGIMIPEARSSKVRGYVSLVVIENGSLATLLGDSENPAHTEWEKNAVKFKNKYDWGPSTIDFVRLSVNKLLNTISQSDEELDLTVLSDIFYIDLPENDEEVPESRKIARKKKPQPGHADEPSSPKPDSKPRTYSLREIPGGFTLSNAANSAGKVRRYEVRMAYDISGASKSKALKSWDKNDFDISKNKYVNKPSGKNVSDVEINGNSIKFTAIDNYFILKVDGFDEHRDLIVDVCQEAIDSEEV
ncbi:hypothetical protein [Thalassolituus sp.]|uniref:hypothetical protein n=1 Tax=Thalassolituus sp. TaxID=2030822 RepID=UPI0035152656